MAGSCRSCLALAALLSIAGVASFFYGLKLLVPEPVKQALQYISGDTAKIALRQGVEPAIWHAAEEHLGKAAISRLSGGDDGGDGLPAATSAKSEYVPSFTACPVGTRVREAPARSISEEEQAWLDGHDKERAQIWPSYLRNIGFDDGAWDAEAFVAAHPTPPRIGLGMSGGGYRALLQSAGVLSVLGGYHDHEDVPDDCKLLNRTNKCGGLLQMSSYLAGLSGAAWFIGSMYDHGFPTVGSYVRSVDIMTNPLHIAGSEADEVEVKKVLAVIFEDLKAKKELGFHVSVTDVWSRFFGARLLPHRGERTRFSDIRSHVHFGTHRVPIPIITANQIFSRRPESEFNAFELSPFEFGSFSSDVRAFIPTHLLNTPFHDGLPHDDATCVKGGDNTAFALGLATSAFTVSVDMRFYCDKLVSKLKDMCVDLLDNSGGHNLRIPPGAYHNPFKGMSEKKVKAPTPSLDSLTLTDSGFGGENIPYWPLNQRARGIGVILSFDTSADDEHSKPSGVTLFHSRVYGARQGVPFARVPFPGEFVRHPEPLLSRATFFSCHDYDRPAVVYVPAHHSIFPSNITTFTLQYTREQIWGAITNAQSIALGDTDAKLPNCIACLLLWRAVGAPGDTSTLPTECETCEAQYCWTPERQADVVTLVFTEAAILDKGDPPDAIGRRARKFVSKLAAILDVPRGSVLLRDFQAITSGDLEMTVQFEGSCAEGGDTCRSGEAVAAALANLVALKDDTFVGLYLKAIEYKGDISTPVLDIPPQIDPEDAGGVCLPFFNEWKREEMHRGRSKCKSAPADGADAAPPVMDLLMSMKAALDGAH